MNQTELKPKRKYNKERLAANSARKARCGHISKTGRYFKCEDCLPELPTDNGDWDYFNLGADDEITEEN